MSLIIKLNIEMTLCVFQGSGLQVAEMQPAIRLHGSTAMLPRQPACRVVMLCKVPLWRRAWNNLLRSCAWVHWFKHALVASELPVGLQGSPQYPAASQSLLLPGIPLQQPYPNSYRYTGPARGRSCTLRQALLFIIICTREVLSRSRSAWRCLIWLAEKIGAPTSSGDESKQAAMQTAHSDLLAILIKLHRNRSSWSIPEVSTDSLAPDSHTCLFKEGWIIFLLPCSLHALRHTLMASCWHCYCKTMILSFFGREWRNHFLQLFIYL